MWEQLFSRRCRCFGEASPLQACNSPTHRPGAVTFNSRCFGPLHFDFRYVLLSAPIGPLALSLLLWPSSKSKSLPIWLFMFASNTLICVDTCWRLCFFKKCSFRYECHDAWLEKTLSCRCLGYNSCFQLSCTLFFLATIKLDLEALLLGYLGLFCMRIQHFSPTPSLNRTLETRMSNYFGVNSTSCLIVHSLDVKSVAFKWIFVSLFIYSSLVLVFYTILHCVV